MFFLFALEPLLGLEFLADLVGGQTLELWALGLLLFLLLRRLILILKRVL